MATRKRRSGTRRKTTRARKTTSTASARRTRRANPARRRRGSVVARSRRRSTGRRRNPSGKLIPLVIGAGVSQIVASLIPFGSGPIFDAVKVAGTGWALEKFLGRAVPTVFGEAKEGGMLAGGVLLFNSFIAPTLRGAISSVMPSGNGNGKGVSGIAVTPYPIAPGYPPLMAPAQAAPAQAAPAGVRGMASVPRFR